MLVRVPDPNSCVEDASKQGDIYIIQGKQRVPIPKSENPAVIKAHFLPEMKRLISLSKHVYAKDWDSARDTGKAWIERGSTNEIPKNLELEEEWKHPSNNSKLWSDAKSDPTIIVVSPYEIGKIKMVCTPSKKDEIIAPRKYYAGQAFKEHGVTLVASGPCKGMYHQNGYYIDAGRAYIRCYWDQIERSYLPPSAGKEVLAEVKNKVLANFCTDSGLVTGTVASADTACMDVLTAVAEFPETAKSVLSGFKTVVSAVKDLKKGRVSISKAHAKKKERDMARHNSSMSQLSRKLEKATRPGERKHWERKIKQEKKSIARARQQAAQELVDALASVWMNFRYNIMPVVYTIEDLQELADSYYAMFKTVRDKFANSFQVELEGWTNSHDVGLRHTCVIKRLIDPNVRFSSLTKANFLSTAYELIPLSFVLDWFINVGDLISALTSPNLSLREGATYSWKCEESLTFHKDNDDSELNINIQIFRREVIDPMSHIGVSLNSTLSLFQKVDALALLWRPIKALLLKSKRI